MGPVEILLGENLKYLREISGLSLTKMAKMSGISYRTLKSIENGGYTGNIRLSQLKNIRKNFGIPCHITLGESTEVIKKIYEPRDLDTQGRIDYFFGKI